MPIRGGISWLSSSSGEIAQAREVLRSLTPVGVIDELGFLVLQGAFAERFYPAVNTIMTRARYLVFVPAIYRHLEESGKAKGKDPDRLARDLQYDLSRALLENEDRVIGSEAGREITRPPSNIYWNAILALGIATERISESSYQDRLAKGYAGPRAFRDDDDAAHPGDDEPFWDPAFRLSHIMPAGFFPSNTRFRLRKAEAQQLTNRYAQIQPDGRDSMLTHLIRLGQTRGAAALSAIGHVWDTPEVPDDYADVLKHAKCLSLFARGVTLQYNRMLIEKRGVDDPGAANAFDEWWRVARTDLRRWNLERFFSLIRGWGAERPSLRDRDFIKNWIERCVGAASAVNALKDETAREIVTWRESHARPGRQRLSVKHHLQSWGVPTGYHPDEIHLLSYRHNVGRQIAQDIAEGLSGGDT